MSGKAVISKRDQRQVVHGPCTTDYAYRPGVLSDGYLGDVDAITADTAYVISRAIRSSSPTTAAPDGINNTGDGSPAQAIFFNRDLGVVIGPPNTANAPVTIWRTSHGGKVWTAVTPTVS